MLSHPLALRRIALTALFALLATCLVLLPLSTAFAHDDLVLSDPERGAVVDVLPAELRLTYSGQLIDAPGRGTEVAVTDAAGTALHDGEPVINGAVLTQALSGPAARGTVTVEWRIVSSDGHANSGEFTFAVGEASDPAAPPEDTGDAAPVVVFWIIGGLAAAAVLGALVYVLVQRARTDPGD